MGKITGFMEFERLEEGYKPVPERLKNYKEFVIGLDDEQAKKQSARCMDCGIPYCHGPTGCPVHNQIPDWNDLVYNGNWDEAIRNLQEVTGGFGIVLGFAHDWANWENTKRSWDMVARYVVPALNGYVRPLQASADYLHANQGELMAGAGRAVMSKIMSHEGA
eukprot:gene30023-52105_t